MKQSTNQNSGSEFLKRTPCEIWTRVVMGYHRPVSQYNRGKKSEYYSRQCFNEQATSNSEFVKEYA